MTDRIEAIRARHAARLGLGRLPVDDDMAALLAEVERLQVRLEAAWTAGDRQAETIVEYVSRLGRGTALADTWRCNCGGPSPEGTHEMHCHSYYGDALRTALAPVAPDAESTHTPMRVLSNMGIPFVDCSCGTDHYVQSAEWLKTHWQGSEAEGVAAIEAVVARQRDDAEPGGAS